MYGVTWRDASSFDARRPDAGNREDQDGGGGAARIRDLAKPLFRVCTMARGRTLYRYERGPSGPRVPRAAKRSGVASKTLDVQNAGFESGPRGIPTQGQMVCGRTIEWVRFGRVTRCRTGSDVREDGLRRGHGSAKGDNHSCSAVGVAGDPQKNKQLVYLRNDERQSGGKKRGSR